MAGEDRLATVVSRLVLESRVPDKMLRLFQLNSAGDLSGLMNVLDDKVISFLNDLFGRPDSAIESVDD
ncbi:MAG: hypothetical protein CL731_04990 [Chloroflexi bacterium]|nr:hypothetical protein [Chloroflexota bacterium]